ncbi:PWI domain-containing protein [Cokeromyces recurvatus]|uniref:PWI domain-containing protein n=1 Tax=Cokeromyces recurvatus TaxID=90255 RepID=UPI002220DE8D|nr:PWI domain-containing protein [Cokeromyces recurvatus]KAI7906117.1 PWI domain-containing protein [Cokeromyces recurvatus]
MGDAGFFKGTSADQDSRFSNKEKKLLKSMSFPPEFDQKVDIKKVNLDVIKPWISNKITELLGLEDEVVIDYTCSLLEEPDLDPKRMQINLTGFLESKTKDFLSELWNLLLSAQNSVGGIPAQFIEQKKEELRRKKAEEEERRAQRESVMDTIRKKQMEEMEDLRESGRRSRLDEHKSSRRYSRSPSRRHRSRSRDDRHSGSSNSRHHSYRDDYYSRHRDERSDRHRDNGRYRDDDRHRESRRSTRRRSRSPGY